MKKVLFVVSCLFLLSLTSLSFAAGNVSISIEKPSTYSDGTIVSDDIKSLINTQVEVKLQSATEWEVLTTLENGNESWIGELSDSFNYGNSVEFRAKSKIVSGNTSSDWSDYTQTVLGSIPYKTLGIPSNMIIIIK